MTPAKLALLVQVRLVWKVSVAKMLPVATLTELATRLQHRAPLHPTSTMPARLRRLVRLQLAQKVSVARLPPAATQMELAMLFHPVPLRRCCSAVPLAQPQHALLVSAAKHHYAWILMAAELIMLAAPPARH